MEVKPNEVAALVGWNGAGKTTLLRVIMGEVGPSHDLPPFAGGLRARVSFASGLTKCWLPSQEEADEGEVSRPPSKSIGVLGQEFDIKDELSIKVGSCGY